jgi:di/tricarboxylate transporter
MTISAWITLAILLAMFVLLFASRLPAAAIFLGALTLCLTLRLAPEAALLAGFSNSGVLTVGVLFAVAAGMYSTGAVNRVVDQVIGFPRTLRQGLTKILPFVAGASAFLNNTPLVAMMIPVVRNISRATGLSSSRLYMPLSFASILGGATTLIGTSTNLIIAGMVTEQLAIGDPSAPPMQPVSFFDPAWVGVPAALVGLGFLIFVGPRLLASRAATAGDSEQAGRQYRAEFEIGAGSLAGKTLEAAGLAHAGDFKLVEWDRAGGHDTADADEQLQPGDRLSFTADAEAVGALWATVGLQPSSDLQSAGKNGSTPHQRFRCSLVEAVVGEGSSADGRAVEAISAEDVNVIGLSRDGRPPAGPLRNFVIQHGDVVALEVVPAFFYAERQQEHFSLTRRLRNAQVPRTERATLALAITGVMVALAAFGVMSMLNAALLAVAAMLITGCVTYRAAWNGIELETLVVLAAAIGLEAAVTSSGLSQVIANVMTTVAGSNPYVALTVVFLGCIVMTNLITNAAAAAFIFPIALAVAGDLGVNFMPFVIVLMLGTSYAFINPAGYQTNLMVYKPGGYTYGDFAKVGVPLTLLVGVVTLVLAPIVFPFHAA